MEERFRQINKLYSAVIRLVDADEKEDKALTLYEDWVKTEELCKTIIDALENNKVISMADVVQIAKYSIKVARYIEHHQFDIEINELHIFNLVYDGSILDNVAERYEEEYEFDDPIERKEVLFYFKAALSYVKEDQDILANGKQLKVQGVYEMLYAVLAMFDLYLDDPYHFNTDHCTL